MINRGKFAILGNCITACDYEYLLQEIGNAVNRKKKLLISPVASQTLVLSRKNKELKTALEKFDYLVPDSYWIKQSLGWLYGIRLENRLYGPDLMLQTCTLAEKQHWRIFLYGTNTDTLQKLKKQLLRLYPRLEIVKAEPSKYRGLTMAELNKLQMTININRSNIVFVATGSPSQELLAVGLANMQNGLSKVIITVGAAFDFISGVKQQAPKWMGDSGFEWLYRLCQEPQRLVKRYLYYGPVFGCLIIKQYLFPERSSSGRR